MRKAAFIWDMGKMEDGHGRTGVESTQGNVGGQWTPGTTPVSDSVPALPLNQRWARCSHPHLVEQ